MDFASLCNQRKVRFEKILSDGSLVHLDEILQMISSEYRSAVENTLLTSISQNEHPHLGVAFYHIHPCRTQEVMRDIKPENYVLR